MPILDTRPTSGTADDLGLRGAQRAQQAPTARADQNTPIKRPRRTRLVATWSADTRPTATRSIDPT